MYKYTYGYIYINRTCLVQTFGHVSTYLGHTAGRDPLQPAHRWAVTGSNPTRCTISYLYHDEPSQVFTRAFRSRVELVVLTSVARVWTGIPRS